MAGAVKDEQKRTRPVDQLWIDGGGRDGMEGMTVKRSGCGVAGEEIEVCGV
jgi:hypothetical protein